jgi:hypothetical protein
MGPITTRYIKIIASNVFGLINILLNIYLTFYGFDKYGGFDVSTYCMLGVFFLLFISIKSKILDKINIPWWTGLLVLNVILMFATAFDPFYSFLVKYLKWY